MIFLHCLQRDIIFFITLQTWDKYIFIYGNLVCPPPPSQMVPNNNFTAKVAHELSHKPAIARSKKLLMQGINSPQTTFLSDMFQEKWSM